MTSHTESLEYELQEKNELILLLTQQLEQAAEQLDRLQRGGEVGRTGDNRQKASLTPALAEGMQHFLADWEQLQPSLTLGRIELALAQLQEAINQGVVPHSGTTSGGHSQQQNQPTEQTPANDFWARMKSEMLEETPGSTEAEAQEPSGLESHREVNDESHQPENSHHTTQLLTHTPDEPFDFRVKRIDEGPDMPPEIDVATASTEDFIHGIEARDEYISYLHDRLSKAEEHEHFKLPIDWTIFNRYPGELRVKLEFLEAQLLSVLRTSEIQQSMERARYARLENKLKFERELIARHASKIGVGLKDDTQVEPEKKQSLRERENISTKPNSGKKWSLWGNSND